VLTCSIGVAKSWPRRLPDRELAAEKNLIFKKFPAHLDLPEMKRHLLSTANDTGLSLSVKLGAMLALVRCHRQ
jgi:hypothetical protein